MQVRKLGVEEELMLVDPTTGRTRSASHLALAAHRDRVGAAPKDGEPGADATIEQELFLHQLETSTRPSHTADELLAELVSCRREAADSSAATGTGLVAVGAAVLDEEDVRVTPKPRYERIVDEFGEIGDQGSVCGMHVHVDVADDAEGVRVIDGLRPWLPVLRAMSVNSPFFHGRDTGHASWRSQVWGRWPSAGPSDPFVDPAGYRSATQALVATGAALDLGMLYFDVRLSQTYPTVEIRVFDAMTEPGDVVLLALLSRALVTTLSGEREDSSGSGRWRHEMLRAAHWRASRYGLGGELLDPLTGARRPARKVVECVVDHVRAALDESGDLEVTRYGLEELLARGTGATRQRAAFERGGLDEVVTDLRGRFEATLGQPPAVVQGPQC